MPSGPTVPPLHFLRAGGRFLALGNKPDPGSGGRGSDERAMWKSVFLALGVFSCMLGIELLLVDSATVIPLQGGPARTVTAPDWAPWALLSVGAVTILHFCTLPVKRSPPTAPNWRGLGH